MGKLTFSEIKFWISEANSCIARQKTELIQRNNYPFLILYYEGVEKINPTYPYVSTHEQMSIINEYFPSVNSLVSEIMYQNPDIIAEAAKPEAEAGEKLMKAALTYAFEKSDALIENRVCLVDMIFAGYCAVEVDHLTEANAKGFDLLPSDTELARREQEGLLKKTVKKVTGMFKKPANTEEAEKKLESELPPKEESYATQEHTYIRRWSPLNVPLDWRADRVKDRRYNFKKVYMSKAEFDAKYPAFKDKITTDSSSLEYGLHSQEIHNKKILLYEFQIKKRNFEYWTLIIAPSYPNEEIDFFKRPYVTNDFNMQIGTLHKYGVLYPISFAQVNKKIQDEMNHYVKFMMEVAERNVPKFVVDQKKVKIDAQEALRSTKVNDLILIDGVVAGAVEPLRPTQLSPENKELIQLFREQKEKLWRVSETKIGGKADVKFSRELQQQEAGFEVGRIDIQEGLRGLIKGELEVLKDIIVNFWDGQYFFKVTGGEKPIWYTPVMTTNPQTGQPMVENPLTDILTGDYFIKIDISTALRPNKERRRAEIIEYLTWLTNPNLLALLQMQGQTINIEVIKKTANEFGLNSESILVAMQPPVEEGAEGEAETLPGGA